MSALPPLLITPADAADLFSISRSSVYELIKSGDLPALKIGGRLRLSVRALEDWVARRGT